MAKRLSLPVNFPFPFEPYEIQKQLMDKVYSNLEDGNLAILESPTGTGKTMSLLCSALTWQRDNRVRERNVLEESITLSKNLKAIESTTSDWLTEQSMMIEKQQELDRSYKEFQALNNHDMKINFFPDRIAQLESQIEVGAKTPGGWPEGAAAGQGSAVPGEETEDADLLLVDLEDPTSAIKNSDCSDSEDTAVNEDVYKPVQIFFCSRTHSQLAQILGEIKRSPFKDSVRVISLASRQTYCINESVQKLKSITLINERCQELRESKPKAVTHVAKRVCTGKTKKPVKAKCPYVQRPDATELLSLAPMVQVLDIEEVIARGKKLRACPYYATRLSLENAEIVLLPYNTLLHRETREASGIKLQGSVIIIDEAHNLLDTISHIHSTEVKGWQLSHAYSQLKQYEIRFRARFSSKNLLFVRQLLQILSRFIKMLGGKAGEAPTASAEGGSSTTMMTLVQFLCSAEIDNFNIIQLVKFCEDTKLPHKLNGYSERYQVSSVLPATTPEQQKGIKAFLNTLSKPKQCPEPAADAATASTENSVGHNPILPFIAFVKQLTSNSKDGRVVVTKHNTVGRGSLKFLLLNPAAKFSDVIKEARSVIVAGGTMQPMSEFRVQLFESAGAPPQRITEFSCGHVVPSRNILPLIVSHGPSEQRLDFSFSSRNLPCMMKELGRCLINLSTVVPAGMVIFFPSYDYERQVFETWTKDGTLASLEKKKKVFRESKTSSGGADAVLSQFSKHIQACKSVTCTQSGAMLFSVVGGKMSEGINFSDDLGRCVVVVGMPYPNKTSPELQEKMTYLNNNHLPCSGKKAGQQYYEDLCMKAVNQCVGRAVRHRQDYATMVLLDHRYHQTNIQASLPGWIQKSLTSIHKFGQAVGSIKKFFNTMDSSRGQ